MAPGGRLGSRPLAGRVGEMDEVVRLVRTAAEGRSGALLIAGEAGVGKTVLVRESCAVVADTVDIVWASCLPLTSMAVPFLPLTSALRGWAGDRGAAVPELARDGQSAGGVLMAFDGWLTDVCRRRPVVFVVDDVQWADQSSLDVLMYVLAGPVDRPLAVVVTQRSPDVVESDALHRWLADVRRLPRVDSLVLGRIDRPATEEQLALLLGRQPHQSLLDDVFGRTQGNPYLTRLLASGLAPDALLLSGDLPTELGEAVRRAWRGLSPAARELTSLLAVAGRPSRVDELSVVSRAVGIEAGPLTLLREAVQVGVLQSSPEGKYWFVHPLLAEVLEAGLLPEERRARHSLFAETLLEDIDSAEQRDLHTIDVADHLFLAGKTEDAYTWALKGADAAARAGGPSECLRLLRRALHLSSERDSDGHSRLDLLDRLRVTAERAGEQEEELDAIEEMLGVLDRSAQPLLAADLLVRRMVLRLSTGREFAGLDGVQEAVRLSAANPSSPQHALATAELADAELWHSVPTGPDRAREAVRLARACGSPRALAYALTAQVMARLMTGEQGGLAGGFAEATEAQQAAVRAEDFFAYVHSTLWGANWLDGTASPVYVEHLRGSRELLVSLGAAHTYVAWLAAVEAHGRLLMGQWRECDDLLRVALGSNPGPMGDVNARLTAALLACWQGRWKEAMAHLARAEELTTDESDNLIYEFDAVRAELAVRAHDTEAAVAAARRGAANEGEKPTLVERLIPLAARALADAAQTARDRRESSLEAESGLRSLRHDFPDVLSDSGWLGPAQAAQVRAMQAWYDAEVCRGLAEPGMDVAWECAADACAASGLAWDEAYATYRWGESLLTHRSSRGHAAQCLRRAYELALELEALPLAAEVEALAMGSRIPLGRPDEGASEQAVSELAALTPREREVLAHIVAGRTYSEIARDLVISEKTVSVHVSNVLRKTGTANRVELAQLAGRLTSTAHRN